MSDKVSIRYCEDYSPNELESSLTKAFDDIGGLYSFIKPKMKVMLKCNISQNTLPNEALTTNPNLIIKLAEMINKIGATSIIVDTPSNTTISNIKIYETTGMLEASNNGYAQLNTNNKVFKLKYDGLMTKELILIDAINDVDVIINVPKLIIDKKLGLKCAGDNLFGLLPTEMKLILKSKLFNLEQYYNYIIDVYCALKNKLSLTIVDGIVARECNDSQRIMNALIVGCNPFSVDLACSIISGIDADDCAELNIASQSPEFEFDKNVTLIGDKYDKFIKPDFTHPKLDTVGKTCFCGSATRKSKYNSTIARPVIVFNECKGCQKCIAICPTTAITPEKDSNGEIYAKIDYSKCINCFRCVETCPYNAINKCIPYKYRILMAKLEKRMK